MKKTAHILEFAFYAIISILLAFFLLPWLFNFKGFMYREDGSKALDFPGTFSAESAPADVFCLGSSHLYTQVIPMKIWEESGIPVYDLRSSLQTIAVSYGYLNEALKSQKPQVVLLDLHMLDTMYLEPDSAITQNVTAGMALSRNKVEMIRGLAPEGHRSTLYFDLYGSHNRWKALEAQDYSYFIGRLRHSLERDYMKGGLFMFAWEKQENRFFSEDPYTEIDEQTYTFNYEYIRKMAQLCKDNGIEFVLTMTLYGHTNDARYRLQRVQQDLAQDGLNVSTLNLNDFRETMGIIADEDMWDYVHTTYEGSMKVSQFIAGWLREQYDLPDRHEDKAWRTWNRDYEKYIDYRDRRLSQFR